MADQYFINLQVKYTPEANDVQRALAWLVPELVYAGLALTEDTFDMRRWTGVVDSDTYTWFADAWDLEAGSHAFSFDGMEFETGGWSPILSVSLNVSQPNLDPVEHQPAHAAIQVQQG